MTASEVIARSKPFDGCQLYAVGVRERGVTVASQQRRAIHLIDALVQSGVIGAGSALAVVGAGAAGLSAAVRAARAGCDVTLLEQDSELLSTFRGNETRLLHPNLYSWPSVGWSHESAELPLLNWSAAKAGQVARDIEVQFHAEVRKTGLITTRLSSTIDVTSSRLRDKCPLLCWTSAGKVDKRRFVAVILAVGFGRERGWEQGFSGYWDNDRLQQRQPLGASYIIQGAGDGGLTDLLRLRLGAFDQHRYFRELLEVGTLEQRESLERAVDDAEKNALDDAALDSFYRKLRVGWLEDAMNKHGPRPVRVLLNDERFAFGRGRFPLNKLFASRLMHFGDNQTQWFQGKLRVRALSKKHPKRISVRLPNERDPQLFDGALVRTGPEGAVKDIDSELVDACLRMTQRGVDKGSSRPLVEPEAAANNERVNALIYALAVHDELPSIVRVLLLSLRHHAADTPFPNEAPEFDSLWQKAYDSLRALGYVVLDSAAEVRDVVCRLLAQYLHVPCAVSARAIAEALDNVFGPRLHRSLRVGTRALEPQTWGCNALHPRFTSEVDFEGRCDGGLRTLAILPAQADLTLRVQWALESWPTPVTIVTTRPWAKFDEVVVTRCLEGGFFGARARKAAWLSRRIASALKGRKPTDFVVLPEFALHFDLATSLQAVCNLFGGVGHIEHKGRRVHRRIMRLTGLDPVEVEKSVRSEYKQDGEVLYETINVAAPAVVAAFSADGRPAIVLTGPDSWSDSALQLLLQLHPRAVLDVGWEGLPDHIATILSERCVTAAGPFCDVEPATPQPVEIIKHSHGSGRSRGN